MLFALLRSDADDIFASFGTFPCVVVVFSACALMLDVLMRDVAWTGLHSCNSLRHDGCSGENPSLAAATQHAKNRISGCAAESRLDKEQALCGKRSTMIDIHLISHAVYHRVTMTAICHMISW